MSITISGNGVITGATTSYSFDQSVSIGGTLTYEDVTNIDSVGVITARSGIQVTGGSIGIGTDTPGALLSIESTAPNAARLRIGFDSPRYYDIFRGSTSNSGYLNFYGSQTGFTGYIFDGVDGERMRIHTSGNIGIGTDNPTGILHVNGSANDESRIAITTPSRSLTRIGYFGLEKFGIDAQDGFQVRDANSSYATRLLIDSSGKVGINETTPSAILDVKGTVSAGGGNNEDLQEWNIGSDNVKAEIKYIDTAANRGMLFGTTTDHVLAFQVNNAERMRIDSSGRLLIGTTSTTLPHLLNVNGVNLIYIELFLLTCCVSRCSTYRFILLHLFLELFRLEIFFLKNLCSSLFFYVIHAKLALFFDVLLFQNTETHPCCFRPQGSL